MFYLSIKHTVQATPTTGVASIPLALIIPHCSQYSTNRFRSNIAFLGHQPCTHREGVPDLAAAEGLKGNLAEFFRWELDPPSPTHEVRPDFLSIVATGDRHINTVVEA